MDSETKTEALEFARSVPAAALGTIYKNSPQIRMMEVARFDDDFTVWFTTARSSNKVQQIGENPNACVLFYSEAADMKILGKAEIITDKAMKDGLYKDKWDRHYTDGGKDDPEYTVVKITPDAVEYRDMKKYGLMPVLLV